MAKHTLKILDHFSTLYMKELTVPLICANYYHILSSLRPRKTGLYIPGGNISAKVDGWNN